MQYFQYLLQISGLGFEQAVAGHESATYQEALAALSDGVDCDSRIVEGLD